MRKLRELHRTGCSTRREPPSRGAQGMHIYREIEPLLHSLTTHIVLQEHWQGTHSDKLVLAGEEE